MSMETPLQLAPLTPLLTVAAVADILNVSERTVYYLIAQKELTSLKVNGARRITREAVLRYIQKGEGAPDEQK